MQWCQHCKIGHGCQIYETRAPICRTFHCRYLLDEDLEEDWKPSTSNFLMTFEEDANRLVVHVDPATPQAWRREPYYSRIKAWAVEAAENLGQVLVWEGDQIVAVLPDREQHLGKVPDNMYILSTKVQTPLGERIKIHVVDENHPLVSQLPSESPKPFA